MWWSLLFTLMAQLLKWLLSEDGPLKPRDEKNLREFLDQARLAERQANFKGVRTNSFGNYSPG